MTAHINLTSLMKNENLKNAKLHWMPCVIKHNGKANVSTYFEPIINSKDNGVLKASFRGYPLLGREVELPKNYCGVVVEEMHEQLNKEADRNLYGTHMFNKFTYWNWDKSPSDNDKIITAMEWLDIAEAIHSPVDS